MEEPRRSRWPRRRLGSGDELDERMAVVDAERRDAVLCAELTEADRLLVEASDAIDVPDTEPDRAEPGLGGEVSHRRAARVPARAHTS